jgi:hypothetical protein
MPTPDLPTTDMPSRNVSAADVSAADLSAADRALLTHAVSDLLARLFQAFDDKDWPMLRDCLCDDVFADYSSFRGVPPETMAADAYVEQRRTAVHTLDMQHNFSNLRVQPGADATVATARCNYVIHRFHPSVDGRSGSPRPGDQFFHSYGHYVFGLTHAAGAWRISRITQQLLRSHGNREIHGATRARPEPR